MGVEARRGPSRRRITKFETVGFSDINLSGITDETLILKLAATALTLANQMRALVVANKVTRADYRSLGGRVDQSIADDLEDWGEFAEARGKRDILVTTGIIVDGVSLAEELVFKQKEAK